MTQLPLQKVSPLAQIDLHVPPWQLVPAPQMLPQPPQLLLSVCSSTQRLLQLFVPTVQHLPLSLNEPVAQHKPVLHASPVAH